MVKSRSLTQLLRLGMKANTRVCVSTSEGAHEKKAVIKHSNFSLMAVFPVIQVHSMYVVLRVCVYLRKVNLVWIYIESRPAISPAHTLYGPISGEKALSAVYKF